MTGLTALKTKTAGIIAVSAVAGLGATAAAAAAAGSTTTNRAESVIAAKVEACRAALGAGHHGIGDCVSDFAMHHGKGHAKHTEDKDRDRDDRSGAKPTGHADPDKGHVSTHTGGNTEGGAEGKSDAEHGQGDAHQHPGAGHTTEGRSDTHKDKH